MAAAAAVPAAAAVAAGAGASEHEQEVARNKRMGAVVASMGAAVVWMRLNSAPVLGPYEFIPRNTAFEFYWQRPDQYRTLCRLTPDEVTDLLTGMGYAAPDLNKGHWKYTVRDRFTVFLMAIADYERFRRMSASKYCAQQTVRVSGAKHLWFVAQTSVGPSRLLKRTLRFGSRNWTRT